MRKQEQKLNDTFRRNKPNGFWLQRVENVVGTGMPDYYIAHKDGGQCWVECKSPKRPKRETTRLLGREGLNQDQINWHLKAANMGIRSFVLIRDSEGELNLLSGRDAHMMNEWPLSMIRKCSLGDNWNVIFEELMDI